MIKKQLNKIIKQNALINKPKAESELFNEIKTKLEKAIDKEINQENIIKALNNYMTIQQNVDFSINVYQIVVLIFDKYKIDSLKDKEPQTLLHHEFYHYISFDEGSFTSLLDKIVKQYPQIDQTTIKNNPYFEENILEYLVNALDQSEYRDNSKTEQKYYNCVMNKATTLIHKVLKQAGYTNKIINK